MTVSVHKPSPLSLMENASYFTHCHCSTKTPDLNRRPCFLSPLQWLSCQMFLRKSDKFNLWSLHIPAAHVSVQFPLSSSSISNISLPGSDSINIINLVCVEQWLCLLLAIKTFPCPLSLFLPPLLALWGSVRCLSGWRHLLLILTIWAYPRILMVEGENQLSRVILWLHWCALAEACAHTH